MIAKHRKLGVNPRTRLLRIMARAGVSSRTGSAERVPMEVIACFTTQMGNHSHSVTGSRPTACRSTGSTLV